MSFLNIRTFSVTFLKVPCVEVVTFSLQRPSPLTGRPHPFAEPKFGKTVKPHPHRRVAFDCNQPKRAAPPASSPPSIAACACAAIGTALPAANAGKQTATPPAPSQRRQPHRSLITAAAGLAALHVLLKSCWCLPSASVYICIFCTRVSYGEFLLPIIWHPPSSADQRSDSTILCFAGRRIKKRGVQEVPREERRYRRAHQGQPPRRPPSPTAFSFHVSTSPLQPRTPSDPSTPSRLLYSSS